MEPDALPPKKEKTATELIRSTLAEQIVRGEIAPGVILEEASLARRFSVSRTPVREAIRQLEAIGFVVARPHRGAVVPQFTPERLTEMFDVMAELEAMCARLAATASSPEAKDRLVNACEVCRKAADDGDIELYRETNDLFHDAIYAASGNGFLAEVTVGVRNRLAPFRRAQFGHSGRIVQSIEEHALITEAIVNGEAEVAAQRAADHLRVVRKSVGAVAPLLQSPEG